MWTEIDEDLVYSTVDFLRGRNLYPVCHKIQGPSVDPEAQCDGKSVLMFCSANYLGLANHPSVKQAVIEGTKEYGIGACGSRLISGTQDIHIELEKIIADFQNAEDSVLYFTVTLANTACIPALMNPPLRKYANTLGFGKVNGKVESAIFADQFSHQSILDACFLAGVDKVHFYKHCDMNHLEKKLKISTAKRKMIVTDGLFSAGGDLAPLSDIVKLAEEYKALIFVDDAHGTGILGENGRGTWEHFSVEDKIDVKIGSLSKAIGGGLGGFVVGNKKFTDYVRVAGRHYIFGGSIPPAMAKGIAQAIDIMRAEPWRRIKVLENSRYLREELQSQGFDTLKSVAHIIPILIGDENTAITIAEELFSKGIFAPSFRYPAVPKGKACIRVNLMATHTEEHLDFFVNTFREVADKYKIRKAINKKDAVSGIDI